MIRDLLRRFVWLTGGSALGRALPLAALLTASRQVDSATFAGASAGLAWAGVAYALSVAGRATVMTQRLGSLSPGPELRALARFHHHRATLASIVLMTLVLVVGPDSTRQLFGTAIDSAVVVPAALAGALWSQVGFASATLNGCHAAREASILLALCGLLQGGGIALGLVLGHSATSMVWGLAGGSAAATVVALALTRRTLGAERCKTAPPTDLTPWWRHPVAWNSLAAWAVVPTSFFTSSLIAGGNRVDSARQLAQYFALEQIHQLVVYVPGVLGQALLPMVSQRLNTSTGARDAEALPRRLALSALAAALAGLCAAFVIGAWPRWFIGLLGNPAVDFQDAWAVRWMFANASLALALALLGGAILGRGTIVTASLLNLFHAVVFVACTMWLAALGNTGLQLSRFVASVLLVVVAAALLIKTGTTRLKELESQS